MRSKISILIAAGLCIVGLTATQVDADSPKSSAVKADFTAVSTPTSIGVIQCSEGGERCVATYTIETEYDGELEGTSLTTGALTLDPTSGAIVGSSYQLITGTIAGCGTGSFIVQLPSFVGRPPAPVVARGTVVDGSGTGDLVGLSGTYSATFTTQADGSGTTNGQLKGWCHARRGD